MLVFNTGNISWSSCGAERSQPSAAHRKRSRPETAQSKPKPSRSASLRRLVRNAMKKGLPGDRLQLVDWELSRGGPFRCCTPVWISAASVSTSIYLTVRERPSRLVAAPPDADGLLGLS